MKHLSYLDKVKLARSLFLDPQTNRAAAYDSSHRLITEAASQKLIDYALAHTESTVAFDAA
jgi:hypothetical protein